MDVMTNFLKQTLGHLAAAGEIYSQYRVTALRTVDPRALLNAPFEMQGRNVKAGR
jgi:hypothetical protein